MVSGKGLSRRELVPRFVGGLVGGALAARGASPQPELVTLRASDGVKVYGWHYAAADMSRPAILLFHQAGSNHAEYATIAPRLTRLGHHCLALDQRSGGRMFAEKNRTAAELGKDVDYRAALPDLEAALEWAPRQGLPATSIVWGSSYSAALVFLLAAKHPAEVAAVLAFSPGEYLGDDHSVRDAAARVEAPVFVTSAQDAEEVEAARKIAAAVPGNRAVQFDPKSGGVHGSSTLIAARNPKGAAANWKAVEGFLGGL